MSIQKNGYYLHWSCHSGPYLLVEDHQYSIRSEFITREQCHQHNTRHKTQDTNTKQQHGTTTRHDTTTEDTTQDTVVRHKRAHHKPVHKAYGLTCSSWVCDIHPLTLLNYVSFCVKQRACGHSTALGVYEQVLVCRSYVGGGVTQCVCMCVCVCVSV